MSTYAGAGRLLAQNLRRDRILVVVVVGLLVAITYASAAATPSLYHTLAQQVAAAEAINRQSAIVALYGPILDVHSLGELAMTKMTVLYAAFSTALFVALIRRHTRVEEESGRAELIGGTAVGRDAPLTAALAEAVLVAAGLGALTAVAAFGGGLPAAGSAWFGLTWMGTGLVGAGVAALACQLAASARTCAMAAAGMLGAAYLIRAAGDASARWHWMTWLSPFGWNTQIRAWSHPRLWILGLYVCFAVGAVAVAWILRSRRDLGSGVLAARPGPATGSARLAGPFGLAARVHRSSLVVWSAAVLGMGVLFGAMAPGLQDMLATAGAQDMINRLGGALIAAVLLVVGMLITSFSISVIAHAASDEPAGRVEEVLATGASRALWWSATVLVACAGSAWLLVLTGGGLWLGYGLAGGPAPHTSMVAALGWIPAVWLVTALASAAVSVASRFAWVGWVVFGGFVTLTMVGDLLKLPGWLIRISPYSAVPAYPTHPWSWTPLAVLTALAAAAFGAAWLRFRVRDIG